MRHRLHLAFEFLLYAILTALMLHVTWLTWPDAFVDFSREVYLPWRVSCGDVLYRDLAYYFGPVYSIAALFVRLAPLGCNHSEQIENGTLHLRKTVPHSFPT